MSYWSRVSAPSRWHGLFICFNWVTYVLHRRVESIRYNGSLSCSCCFSPGINSGTTWNLQCWSGKPVYRYSMDYLAMWIRISHDGVGRCIDNVGIERFWRTLKYEDVYLRHYRTVPEARKRITAFIQHYNYHRSHQALSYARPADLFFAQTQEKFVWVKKAQRSTLYFSCFWLCKQVNHDYPSGKK